jgi:hypothetical protein
MLSPSTLPEGKCRVAAGSHKGNLFKDKTAEPDIFKRTKNRLLAKETEWGKGKIGFLGI